MNQVITQMVEEAKRILEHGCPEDDNHFLRCEVAVDESHVRVWCSDCGWGCTVSPEGIGPLRDGSPVPAPAEDTVAAEFMARWIESHGGSTSVSWELPKLAAALRPIICQHV